MTRIGFVFLLGSAVLVMMSTIGAPTAQAQRPNPTQVVIAGDLGAGGTFQSGTGMAWATGPGAPPCNNAPCDPANAVSFSVPAGTYYAMTQFKVAFNWSAGANSVTVGLYMFPGSDSAAAINAATLIQSFTMTSPAGSTGQPGQLVTQVLNSPVLLMPGSTYYLEMVNSNPGSGPGGIGGVGGGLFGWQWNSIGRAGYYAAFLPQIGAVPNWGPENCDGCYTPAFEIDGQTIEPVYVSTQGGSQILLVDGNTGAFGVVLDGFNNQLEVPFSPEGITFGPDGNLYVTDPDNCYIWQMTPNGGNFVQVAHTSSCLGGPGSLFFQGPSFSSSPTGDLYFNTKNGGVYEIPAAATSGFGPFQAPVEIVPNATCVSNCAPPGGAGTSFDSNDNLLFDEQFLEGDTDEVLSLSPNATPPPPYAGSPSITLDGLTQPTGIARNKANGNMYVANTGAAQILQTNAPVPPYYTFGTPELTCGDFSGPDFPMFLASDVFGSFFVVTTRDKVSDCAKLWRIDPGDSPTAVLLLDLSNPPAGSPTLHTNQAVGVAVAPMPTPAQTFPLSPGGGSFTAEVPMGCEATNTCSAMYTAQYCKGCFPNGETATVTFNDTPQTLYSFLVSNSNYSKTACVPVLGYQGDCLPPAVAVNCPVASCPTQGGTVEFTETLMTNEPFCSLIPHFLQADPPNGSVTGIKYTSVLDIITQCFMFADPGGGTKGQSSCAAGTSSSQCLSDFPIATGPTTQNASVVATESITSPPPPPAPPATYQLNQSVTAIFGCSSSPNIVQNCVGSVTNPAYVDSNGNPIVQSVTSGGMLPTSQLGTNTLSVTAEVTGGSPGTGATETYYVTGYYVCLLYASDAAVKSGADFPIKMYLCDANGNDLSSSNIVVNALQLILVSTNTTDDVMETGNSNPDNDFRFDSTLGPTGGYIFNEKTTGLAKGSYLMQFKVSTDPPGATHTVPLGIK